MSSPESVDSSDDIVLEIVSGDDVETIARAIELGNGSRKTLGLLPREAYHEAAKEGRL